MVSPGPGAREFVPDGRPGTRGEGPAPGRSGERAPHSLRLGGLGEAPASGGLPACCTESPHSNANRTRRHPQRGRPTEPPVASLGDAGHWTSRASMARVPVRSPGDRVRPGLGGRRSFRRALGRVDGPQMSSSENQGRTGGAWLAPCLGWATTPRLLCPPAWGRGHCPEDRGAGGVAGTRGPSCPRLWILPSVRLRAGPPLPHRQGCPGVRGCRGAGLARRTLQVTASSGL